MNEAEIFKIITSLKFKAYFLIPERSKSVSSDLLFNLIQMVVIVLRVLKMIEYFKSEFYFFVLNHSKSVGIILLLASIYLMIEFTSQLIYLNGYATQIQLMHTVLELGIFIVSTIVSLILIITPKFFTYCDLDIFSNKTHKMINNVLSPIAEIIG